MEQKTDQAKQEAMGSAAETRALHDEELEKVTAGEGSWPVTTVVACPYCRKAEFPVLGEGDITRCPVCGMEFNVEGNVKFKYLSLPEMSFNDTKRFFEHLDRETLKKLGQVL